jgi:hypothetical protein
MPMITTSNKAGISSTNGNGQKCFAGAGQLTSQARVWVVLLPPVVMQAVMQASCAGCLVPGTWIAQSAAWRVQGSMHTCRCCMS